MGPRPERPPAQLKIPKVPNFPFSSPITEEIMTPASCSSDDRDMERNRPFEFLSKMSNRNLAFYKTRSSGTQLVGGQNVSQTPGRQGNMERPAGLNLITDISRSTPQVCTDRAPAPFVDLNDLKVLSREREEERSAQGIKSILKKGNNEGFQRIPDDPFELGEDGGTSSCEPVSKGPKKRFKDDLSPSDRPIMIGLTVPHNEYREELDSAGTQQTPLTPSIIVTPAKEDGFWTRLQPPNSRSRIASSVYSQPTPYLGNDSEIPPVPAIPSFRLPSNSEGKGPASPHRLSIASVRKRRSFSTGAVGEKEEGQKPVVRPRSYSNETLEQVPNRLSVNTQLNGRASQGWWNYLLSPLFGRSSSLRSRFTPSDSSPPPIPKIKTHLTGSTDTTDEWWEEKEKSYFSPDTPETTRKTTSWQANDRNPFADFDWSIDNQSEKSGQRGIPSPTFPGSGIQGEAAEYYQACAHELFSGKPYFECINHVCSITPKDKIAAYNYSSGSPTGDTHGAKGLLINVDDMPSPEKDESRKSVAATTIVDSPEESTARIGGFGSTDDGKIGTPKASSEIPRGTSDPQESVTSFENHYEKQSTNPFFQAPATVQPPVTHVHVQPAAAAAPPPSIVYIQQPRNQAPSAAQKSALTPFPDSTDFTNARETTPPPLVSMPSPTPMGPTRSRGQQPTPPPVSMPSPDPMGYTKSRAQQSTTPPPISMPSPDQMPPPRYGVQAHSPYPPSPGLLQATERAGSIRLDNMPAGPAPAYTSYDDSSVALPPRIAAVPITRGNMTHPVTERERIEYRRRRHEREDAMARKAGGLWRGRGPFSNKGCFGRPGREGRLRRRWYFVILVFFIIIVVGAVLLAIFLTRAGDKTPVQSQWLNLTGYPPMPTGISTIAGPEPQVQEPGCIPLPSLWSCALPKEQQSDNHPYAPNQPNFRVEIRFRNGTYDRSTEIASRSTQLLASRSDNQLFNPTPLPPDMSEQSFLGNSTDKNSAPYSGEETPFYMTMLSPVPLSSIKLARRAKSNDTSAFPDIGSLIPSPAVDSDGTAAPAALYPLPESQPVRLYNRGQKDEHYGFYTYFDKSIFLESSFPLSGIKDDSTNKQDANGGSQKENARVRCTWSQTRFLVQIWTRPDESGKYLLDNSTTTTPSSSMSPSPTTTSQATSSSSATDFTRPGSFPYPITITVDRHGGKVTEKMVYCYGMEADQHINGTEKKFQVENRGFNGQLFNPAPGLFETGGDKGDSNLGGYDGGSGGCACKWTNWIGAV